jgi:hypothetical protein
MLPDLGYPVYTMVYYSTPDIGDITRLRLPCLQSMVYCSQTLLNDLAFQYIDLS